jgi:hypothetical protein
VGWFIQQPSPQLGVEELTDLEEPSVAPIGATPAKNSARAMNLDVDKLLCHGGLLGQRLPKRGKAFVMEECARRAVDGFRGGSVSFNKYSGVQEFGNDVIFLWINLNAPNCDVINEFPAEGRQVTWYGGSRMHDGTNAIRNLKRIGLAAATGRLGPSGGVVLWCRRYDQNQKTFGAYICLGRLSVCNGGSGHGFILCKPTSHLPSLFLLLSWSHTTPCRDQWPSFGTYWTTKN